MMNILYRCCQYCHIPIVRHWQVQGKEYQWSISETTLLTIAAIGGSIGDWICMLLWHHKTMHKKSKYGIPFIITLQIALVVYLRTNNVWT